jgi:hypothetical protein
MFNQLHDWSLEYLDYDFIYYFETTIDNLCLMPWYFKRFVFAIRCWWFWVYEAEKVENGRKIFIESPYHWSYFSGKKSVEKFWSVINEGLTDMYYDSLNLIKNEKTD